MSNVVAVMTVMGKRDDPPEAEVRAASLEALFDLCRAAPPSRVVRISLHGPGGEVRLNFASFIRA